MQDLSTASLSLFLSSIGTILPQITRDHLDYPKVCKNYYNIINNISSKANFFAQFSKELFYLIFSILIDGINHKNSEASRLCLESLKTLLTFNYSHRFESTKNEYAFQSQMINFPNMMSSLLALILDSLIFHKLNFDSTDLAIDCLLSLIFDHKDHFIQYVENLLNRSNNNINNNNIDRGIILQAVANLTANVTNNLDIFETKNFKVFRSNFRNFQTEVQKYLLLSNNYISN